MCNEIEGSYDKIIIIIVPSYTGKNITCLLPLALLLVLCTRSSIALYYGDTYILSNITYQLITYQIIMTNMITFQLSNMITYQLSNMITYQLITYQI